MTPHPQALQEDGTAPPHKLTIGVYPGSFDPLTNGHLDIIRRALYLFDKVIVVIAINPKKKPLFTLAERIEMIQECFQEEGGRVLVDFTEGLMVDYAIHKKARAIIRGLRAVSDFDYEFQLALMNRKLEREVDTIFLMTGLRWIYISSSIIKEAARCGGDVSELVPIHVQEALRRRFADEPCNGAQSAA